MSGFVLVRPSSLQQEGFLSQGLPYPELTHPFLPNPSQQFQFLGSILDNLTAVLHACHFQTLFSGYSHCVGPPWIHISLVHGRPSLGRKPGTSNQPPSLTISLWISLWLFSPTVGVSHPRYPVTRCPRRTYTILYETAPRILFPWGRDAGPAFELLHRQCKMCTDSSVGLWRRKRESSSFRGRQVELVASCSLSPLPPCTLTEACTRCF